MCPICCVHYSIWRTVEVTGTSMRIHTSLVRQSDCLTRPVLSWCCQSCWRRRSVATGTSHSKVLALPSTLWPLPGIDSRHLLCHGIPFTYTSFTEHRTQTDRQTDRQTDWYLLFYAVSQCYKLNLMPKQYRIVNSNIIIVVRPFSVCVSPNIARSNFVPSVWIVYGQRLITTSIRTVGLHQRRYCQRSLLGSRLQPR